MIELSREYCAEIVAVKFSMRVRICVAIAVAVSVAACATIPAAVTLAAEEHTIVHVGDAAALSLPTGHQFTGWGAGGSLALIKRTRKHGREVYLYRAVQPGNETFLSTPRALAQSDCISCVTAHYFVTVIP